MDDESHRPGWLGFKAAAGLVGLVALAAPVWLLWERSASTEQAPEAPAYQPIPVVANRAGDTPEGFRGSVHALLRPARKNIEARWSKLGVGRDELEKSVPPEVYALFAQLKPAAVTQTYSERDFSVFMPRTVESPGQMWALDLDEVARLLRQFHPRPNMHVVSRGRRAGPDGAFALLRAISPTHLDILFRIHAEFDIAQDCWLTPACFWGRMVVNKEKGSVEHFRIWLPTDNPLNMHLTVTESTEHISSKPKVFRKIMPGDLVFAKRDIVRVERMELASADSADPDGLDWTESIDMEAARLKLKQSFYTFAEIDWVPWSEAVEQARERHKPILAIVLWGALDDQSC